MSQAVRNHLTEDLCENGCLSHNEVSSMTDAEVEYYHWLYLEESVLDLM